MPLLSSILLVPVAALVALLLLSSMSPMRLLERSEILGASSKAAGIGRVVGSTRRSLLSV